ADKQKWGAALAMGHLTMLSKWSTSRTHIILVAYGENNSAHVMLEYNNLEALKKFQDSVAAQHTLMESQAKCSGMADAVKIEEDQSTGVTSFSITEPLDRTVTTQFYWSSSAPEL